MLWQAPKNTHDSTTSPPSAQEPSRFLDLPLEIRGQIYGYLLPCNGTGILQTTPRSTTPQYYPPSPPGSTNSQRLSDPKDTRTWPEIIRVSKQIHDQVHTYFFFNSIIKIHIDETGYSFLEKEMAGYYLDYETFKVRELQRMSRPLCQPSRDGPVVQTFRPGDRVTDWHKAFIAAFDFSLPKKLIISIEAAPHANPKHVLRIRNSVLDLCKLLRAQAKLPEIEVQPQSQTYRFGFPEKRSDIHDPRGSYFVWKRAGTKLEPFLANSRRPSRRVLQRDRLVVWDGGLSSSTADSTPDLGVVSSYG